MGRGHLGCGLCAAALFWLTCPAQIRAQAGSLREGYVIVTPTFGDQTRLSAFETFRYRGSSGSSQASVTESTLATNASIFVTSDVLSERNSALALVNPGSTGVQVTLTLYRGNVSVLDSNRISVPAGQQVTYYITELFPHNLEVQTGFVGLLNIVSSSPVGIVGLRFQDSDFSTVPLIRNLPFEPTVPPLPNGAGGPGALLFPQFAAGSGWTTDVALTNTSNGPLTVRVDVFDNFGTPMAFPFTGPSTFTIVPNGVVVLGTAGR